MITRRHSLHLLGATLGAATLFRASPGSAQGASRPVSAEDLAVVGPLGEQAQGQLDAKVTIIEYSSLTCPHCAAFHRDTYPQLKSRYIDTGKVRFTLREFPLDPLATAAFMLARCDGNDKYYPITDLLFDQQRNWAFVQKPQSPVDALEQLLRQAGFSKEKFEGCLKDQKIYTAINGVKTRGLETFKIESTPTFFINGRRFSGAMTIEEMEKVIKPIIES